MPGKNDFPWINPWREELRALLSPLPVRRKPALRRSLRADYLFAVDLPACAEPTVCQSFLHAAAEAGWQAEPAAGWINLRKNLLSAPPGWFPEHPEGEAACLRELVRRHGEQNIPLEFFLRLLKAREEGPAAWEDACRAAHQDFARRLRTGERIPLYPID